MGDDFINRQEVIQAIRSERVWVDENIQNPQHHYHMMNEATRILSIVGKLPSVQQKTAYWIDVSGDVPIYNAGGFTEKRKIGVKCSNCQRLNTWCEFDYCPHCGAKMEGETE